MEKEGNISDDLIIIELNDDIELQKFLKSIDMECLVLMSHIEACHTSQILILENLGLRAEIRSKLHNRRKTEVSKSVYKYT